jgi:hypothetical protein
MKCDPQWLSKVPLHGSTLPGCDGLYGGFARIAQQQGQKQSACVSE